MEAAGLEPSLPRKRVLITDWFDSNRGSVMKIFLSLLPIMTLLSFTPNIYQPLNHGKLKGLLDSYIVTKKIWGKKLFTFMHHSFCFSAYIVYL